MDDQEVKEMTASEEVKDIEEVNVGIQGERVNPTDEEKAMHGIDQVVHDIVLQTGTASLRHEEGMKLNMKDIIKGADRASEEVTTNNEVK